MILNPESALASFFLQKNAATTCSIAASTHRTRLSDYALALSLELAVQQKQTRLQARLAGGLRDRVQRDKLLIEPNYPVDQTADDELQQGLPFIQAELATQEVFDYHVNTFFGTDRRNVPKGTIEVLP